ncbi:Fructosamine kinase [Crateriforma conspicua]|uniref:Fructosamine kinase n=1 Tax=Crateriforma conspicua TaxID=2527996 RepID=A0A5C6FME5_9PLAN|nr:fructosamine kinase family protein [Crateriforma conspicua]TWU61009.1 Fructosamine kinase [Crateriforma conspicua]
MMMLKDWLPRHVPQIRRIDSVDSVGGGCISDAVCVRGISDQDKPETWFVKANTVDFAENFACELDGLNALRSTGVIHIPEPIATGIDASHSFLVTRWIPSEPPTADFFTGFGRRLAEHHVASETTDDRHGWHRDNFLGATVQPNQPCESWVAFVAQQRIGHQLSLAVENGWSDSRLKSDVQKIIDHMDDLLSGRHSTVSLLHGDLWSGNYLCTDGGRVALIDPAVYRGCAEAEFGMIQLFGSCPPEFYDAYQDVRPLADGWRRRVQVYVLYHLLNHLNLFGGGYLSQCQRTAAMVLRGR